MPALRTKDTLVRSLEVTTTLSSPTSSSCAPMLAIISPTPRAFTFPINHNLEDSPYSTPSSSPFQPELSLAGGLGVGVGGGLEPFYTHTQGGNGGNGNGTQTVLLPSPMSSTPLPRTLSPSVLSTPSSSSSNTSSNPLSSPITGSSTSSLTQTHKRRKSSHSVDPLDRSKGGNRGDNGGGVERRPKKGDEDYIKRPENAFILFRRKCCEERDAGSSTTSTSPSSNSTTTSTSSTSSASLNPSSSSPAPANTATATSSTSPSSTSSPSKDAPVKKQRQADLSKTISQQWKSLAPEERAYWEELAKEKKREHERMYPNYVYRPQRSKSKVTSSSTTKSGGEGGNGGRSGREGGEKKERTGKKGREVSKERVSVGKVDEDDAESKDIAEEKEKEKEEERISFVVPLLPSHHHSHSPSHSLSIGGGGGGGGGGFYNSRPHGRSISAPTPPPVPQFQQYLYAPQQVQQHMLGGGQQQQQQQISIPNVYSASMPNSPHASFSSAFNPNNFSNASSSVYSNGYTNMTPSNAGSFGAGGIVGGGMGGGMGGGLGGMGMMRSMSLSEGMPLPGMLPTSPTSDVPMISGTGRRSSHSGVTTPSVGAGFESSDFLRGMYSMGGDAPSSSPPTSTSTSSTSSSTPTPSTASTTSASSQAGSAHRQLSPLATIALAHSTSTSHSNNGNGISPASSGPSTPLSAFSPFSSPLSSLSPSSASTTSSGLVHALQQSSLNDFASHDHHHTHDAFGTPFSGGFNTSPSIGFGGGFSGGLAGMGLAGMGVPSIDDGLYGGDMNVCSANGMSGGRNYDEETSHWTQMQNALNGNGVFDYTNPAERFVEPAPHSSHVNNNLLNAATGGNAFGAQGYAGGNGGYDGMYGFNKGLDAFSFSSSMDVDMFNTSTSFANPSSFPNTHDEAHTNGASEAEMAAYEWEHSPTSFSSSSSSTGGVSGFMPDDFDISAIPPIEIGLPKFGGSGAELSYGMNGDEHTQHGGEGEGVDGGEVGTEAREAVSTEVV